MYRCTSSFFVIPMSQVKEYACMNVFIWRTVITEMKRSEIEVLPGNDSRVGVYLLDYPDEPSKGICLHKCMY